MSEFERSLAKALVHEGGWSNHPDDPGGATMKGVIQRNYDAYRRDKGLPTRSVRLIETHELREIYRKRYWDMIKGDQLPPGVSYVVFDGAVNSGPAQSVKWLQRALGVKVDGAIGQDTLAAVKEHPNHDALIAKILDRRMAFLKALKNWKSFKNGWTSRVKGVLAVGQAWAMGDIGPEVIYVPGAEQKARIENAKTAPSTAPGDLAAGGGTMSTLITQATDQLAPLQTIEFVGKTIAILTAAGVVVAISGILYRTWANKKAKALADALDTVAA